jgi:hypothetical protein
LQLALFFFGLSPRSLDLSLRFSALLLCLAPRFLLHAQQPPAPRPPRLLSLE